MRHEHSERQMDETEKIPKVKYEDEPSSSVVRRKARFCLTNITLEPVLLFYGVIKSMDRIAQNQLIIGKYFVF